MQKKKTYTILWTFVNIICWGILAILVRDIVIQIKNGPEKRYVAQEISISHNKYGDYLVGLLAKQKHDYDTMIESFEAALSQDPNNQKLKQNVYLLKAIRGDIDDIIPIAEDLNKLRQGELLTDYVLVADNFKKKSYDKAEKLLDTKPPYGSDRVLKPILKAWIAVGQNNRAAAEKELAALLPLKSEALYHYYMALVALAFRDEAAAEKSFHSMHEKSGKGYPSLTSVIFMRDFYLGKNKWRAGIPEYDQAETLLNSSPSVKEVVSGIKAPATITPQIGAAVAFYDVSVALAPLKLEETCLILNALAMHLMPDGVAFKIWAGELLEMSGNHQAANRVYQKIKDQNDVILMKKALNLVAMEEYAKSIEPLKTLAEHNPDDGYIQMMLADSFLQTKAYENAIKAYTKASAFFQNEKNNTAAGHALFMTGMAYDRMGQTDKAEEKLLAALRLIPNSAEALNYLGYLWLDMRKNIDEAFEMVQKAATLRPDDPNIMDSLALGYYLKKDYEKALELAEKSTDQISYSSVAYAHLGDIYAALNRPQEAHYQYRKALDLTADITPKLKAELEKKLNLTR